MNRDEIRSLICEAIADPSQLTKVVDLIDEKIKELESTLDMMDDEFKNIGER